MRLLGAWLAFACVGCGTGDIPYERLRDYDLFEDQVAQIPAEGVVPYDVNSILFADESVKWRFMVLPEGGQITWVNDAPWEFPDGTILVKTFGYYDDYRDPAAGERLLETRLLIKQAGAWSGHVYLWDDAQTRADRLVAGKTLDVAWIDAAGTSRNLAYRVPNTNQCASCHSNDDQILPLGPDSIQMNRDRDYGAGLVNQIDHLDSLGLFDQSLPAPGSRPTMPRPDDASAPVDERARAYLESNCSHCHQRGGAAASSALDLRWETPFGTPVGECKTPVAAGAGAGGLRYVIQPSISAESILVFRMVSTKPEEKMPELRTALSDPVGVQLVSDWIDAMPPRDCTLP